LGFACQLNEMAAESHHRNQASDHAAAELMGVKSKLQQINSQLSEAQQVLAAKVSSNAVLNFVF